MKKNKIIASIIKWMPLYLLVLLFLFINRYINSLTALFIGEFLGLFNGDKTVMPHFINHFVVADSIKSRVISLSIIYIILTTINVASSFLARTLRVVHYQKLYIDLSTKFYNHVIDIEKSEYASRSTGDIIQRNIEDCKRIPMVLRNSLYEIFRIIFTTSTLLIQLYALTKSIFIVSVISVILCLGFSGYYGYFLFLNLKIPIISRET